MYIFLIWATIAKSLSNSAVQLDFPYPVQHYIRIHIYNGECVRKTFPIKLSFNLQGITHRIVIHSPFGGSCDLIPWI